MVKKLMVPPDDAWVFCYFFFPARHLIYQLHILDIIKIIRPIPCRIFLLVIPVKTKSFSKYLVDLLPKRLVGMVGIIRFQFRKHFDEVIEKELEEAKY